MAWTVVSGRSLAASENAEAALDRIESVDVGSDGDAGSAYLLVEVVRSASVEWERTSIHLVLAFRTSQDVDLAAFPDLACTCRLFLEQGSCSSKTVAS